MNVGLLVGAYLVVSFGLLPMIYWGGAYSGHQIALIGRLVGRILPLLLLFSAFLFLNAEVWQVAHDFSWPYYAIVLGVIGVFSLGSVAVRIPSGAGGLGPLRKLGSGVRADQRL